MSDHPLTKELGECDWCTTTTPEYEAAVAANAAILAEAFPDGEPIAPPPFKGPGTAYADWVIASDKWRRYRTMKINLRVRRPQVPVLCVGNNPARSLCSKCLRKIADELDTGQLGSFWR